MASSSSASTSKRASSSQKRSKHESFRALITSYLRQKNYVIGDKFRKSELKLVENKQQFMLRKMLERDLAKHNTFTYSNVLSIRNNPHLVDQHFGRFYNFVETHSDPMRSELKRFYAPIMCHLYLELMRAQNTKAAFEFLHKYSHFICPIEEGINNALSQTANAQDNQLKTIIFQRDDENVHMQYFKNLIETLSSYNKFEQLQANPDVQRFCSTKYIIETTQAVVDAVRTFFERRGHVVIMHVLNTWIHVQSIDNEVPQWTEEFLFFSDATKEEDFEGNNLIESYAIKEIKTDIDAEECGVNSFNVAANVENNNKEDIKMDSNLRLCLETLRETKVDIIKVQPDFPHFIKVMERNRGLTSADMDRNECHLAAGFNSSVVQLWPMTEERFSGRNMYHRPTHIACSWNLNNCTREEEDDIDRDLQEERSNEKDYQQNKFSDKKYEDNSYNDYGGIELRGHGSGVTEVRFSTHFPLLYSVSKDATMRCWRSESYQCGAIYRGHRYPIWCFDESPVKSLVVTGSKDMTARLWSLEREFPFITYVGHTQDVECVAFHPNGNYIASGSSDLSVRLWDVSSGKLLRVFSDCKQPVCSMAFSPDGRKLAAGGEEKKVRIFDIAAGSQLGELKENSACVSGIVWSEDNKVVATSCRDGTCRLYNIHHLSPLNKTQSQSTSPPVSSPSTLSTPLMSMSSNCQRLVRIFYNRHNRVCCIGGFN